MVTHTCMLVKDRNYSLCIEIISDLNHTYLLLGRSCVHINKKKNFQSALTVDVRKNSININYVNIWDIFRSWRYLIAKCLFIFVFVSVLFVGHFQGFVSKLDEFIFWLREALENTENWTPPQADIDSLSHYLETHLVSLAHAHTWLAMPTHWNVPVWNSMSSFIHAWSFIYYTDQRNKARPRLILNRYYLL